MYYRCTTDVLQMYFRCTYNILQMCYRCTTDVLQIYYRCTTDLLQMYFRCTTDVLQIYFRCTSDVLQIYYRCTTDVLLRYRCITCNKKFHKQIMFPICICSTQPFSRWPTLSTQTKISLWKPLRPKAKHICSFNKPYLLKDHWRLKDAPVVAFAAQKQNIYAVSIHTYLL